MPESETPRAGRKRGDTVVAVARETREAILSGRLAMGQRLIEADLTREFGVGRSSVREAIRHLSSEGLVEIVPHRGAVVRRLTRAEVVDRYEIREVLEGLAARLVAARIGDPAIRQGLLDASGAEHGASIADYRMRNYRLHGAIGDLSGNAQLAAMIRQLWLPAVMSELRDELGWTHWRQSEAEHQAIIDAILAGDGEAAEARMRAHLRQGAGRITALPTRVFGP
jgi:DNA-binding GntR family transcriptional regulator